MDSTLIDDPLGLRGKVGTRGLSTQQAIVDDPLGLRKAMIPREVSKQISREKSGAEALKPPDIKGEITNPVELATNLLTGGTIGALKGSKYIVPEAIDWATWGGKSLAKGLAKAPGAFARGLSAKEVEKRIPAAMTTPKKINIPQTAPGAATAFQVGRSAVKAPTEMKVPPIKGLFGSQTGSVILDTGLVKNKEYIDKYVQDMTRLGRSQPLYEKGSLILPKRVRPLVPDSAPIRPSKDISKASTIQSPHQALGRAFSVKDNPVIDSIDAQQAFIDNNIRYRQWSNDVLRQVPDASKDITQALKPIFQKHQGVINEVNIKQDELATLKTEYGKYPNKKVDKAQEIALEIYKKEQEIKQASKGLAPLNKDHKDAIERLAKSHPDVRVYLAAADELPAYIKLSSGEARTAKRLKSYMLETKDRLKQVGIPILDERAYMPRIWSSLMKDEESKNIFKQLDGTPSILSFVSRVPNTRSWFPSAHATMRAYIPTVEYKLAYQPFLNRWNRVINSIQQPVVRDYMQKWVQKNMYATSQGAWEKGINAAVGLQYARLIGLSMSVGAKHLLKLANTWATYGPEASAKGTYAMMKVPVQKFMKATGLGGRDAELQATKIYTNTRSLVQSLDEIPGLKDAKNVVKRIIGQPVIGIEAFDNGVSVLAGIIKGSRRGMKAEDIHRGILDTILSANFRSGWDQPLWQKSTLTRALTMFQSTPFKLLEFKAKLIEGALKGQKDAFGTYYGTQLAQYVVAIGLGEMLARKNGTSILEMFLHIPFLRDVFEPKKGVPFVSLNVPEVEEEFPYMSGGPKYAGTPANDLIYAASKGGLPALLKSAFIPELPKKVYHIMQGDIPERYESAPRYLLGLSKVIEEEGGSNISSDDPLGLRR